jgi:CubicO group peptidase (beta-lactamase class C family)
VLLGRIIEVLDGREWDTSLRERLIGPLGLEQTVTLPEQAILHRAATGHRQRPRQDVPVSVWGLPRSVGPAGLITASTRDVLAFARLHLDAGAAPDGARLLGPASVSAMQQPQADIPSADGHGDAVGLTWRLNRWDGRQIIGHDGGTIGQTAYLRVDPQSRVAACLLTNASESQGLYRRLFSEIFSACAGITVPDGPQPAADPVGLDLQRHAGRYERTSWRYDVCVRDGLLHVIPGLTDARETFSDDEPKEFDLHPTDATGDRFVGRLYDSQPWSPVVFGRLDDQTPYIYAGGRITLRVG